MRKPIKLLIVTAAAIMLAALMAAYQSAQAGGPWYVAPGGNDFSDCLSPATACASVNGALAKPGFVAGDTVLLAAGTYTGTGSEVVLLQSGAVLSGGWDVTFNVQSGMTIVDGQSARRVLVISAGVTANIDHLIIENGVSNGMGGGIFNAGTVTVSSSTIARNMSAQGGGLFNTGGTVLITASLFVSNQAQYGGAIVTQDPGMLSLVNSTVSENAATAGAGGGIDLSSGGLSVIGSKVVGNSTSMFGGGLYLNGAAAISNSVIGWNSGDGIQNDGILTVTYSSIVANSATGLTNYGTATVINSTISNNIGGNLGRGGGIFNTGTLDLYSSTIYSNTVASYPPFGGGGIWRNAGTVTLYNTIVSGNSSSGASPDCNSITSGGYVLIGNSAQCILMPGPGDLLDINPLLFPLIGSPGFDPLIPGSPAINAGNPAGCLDNMGKLLTTDERGVPRAGRCDMGAYEYDPNYDPLKYALLPAIFRDYCADYADAFSNPGSGWFVTNTVTNTFAYNGGEYQIVGKRPGLIYTARAPQCDRQSYVVQADARWAGTVNNYYSLLFGVTPAFDQYYVFEVNPNVRAYRLRLRQSNGVISTLIGATSSSAINAGLASNHLKVTRNGVSITLEVNGTLLTTVSDATIGGWTGAGLSIRPYDNALPGDARFDNFSVSALPAAVLAAPAPGSGTQPSVLRASGANRDPEPDLAPAK